MGQVLTLSKTLLFEINLQMSEFFQLKTFYIFRDQCVDTQFYFAGATGTPCCKFLDVIFCISSSAKCQLVYLGQVNIIRCYL